MKKLIPFIVLSIITLVSFSQEVARRTYQTKYTTTAPQIDGFSNDPCWNLVEWSGDFTQTTPFENKPPSQQTAFKILYDDNNLYVFIRAFDTEAGKISRILSRRDGFSGDMVEINIDSYFDKQTAFSFTAMASGAKGDEAISLNGDNWDSSWNPVWTLKTSIDDQGWNAEMCIPLTQLRFGNKEEHVWGIELMRHIYRLEERSHWQYIPKGSPGFVHLFGELHGIKNIKPKRQVEVLPYVVAKVETYEKQPGNPFADGRTSKITAGVDGKIGITNDLTLDFTVNPDFGQVEADPSEVNLTAFESYFSEQRPFFVEGKNIYQFRPTNPIVINDFGMDNLFYSRRIGRYPQYYPETASTEYVKMPEASTILTALKLSGKTKRGLSIGILESTTANEKAEIDNNGIRRKESVEPLTNYFVARLQKDFNKGETTLGGMFTAVNRDITNPAMSELHKAAYSAGFDFKHSWKDRTYYFIASGVFSNVQGKASAIESTQTSSARYYQRPDAKHLSLDTTLTSLSGYGGSLRFGKQGQKKIQYETSINFKSPGLEFNDIGFMRSSDIIHHGTWMGYYIRDPFSIFLNFYLNLNYWAYWNFNGDLLSTNANMNFNSQFKNRWNINGSFSRQNENLSTTLLRGGQSIILPGSWDLNLNLSSDNSKKVGYSIGGYYGFGDCNASRGNDYWVSLSVRPVNSVAISISPDYYFGENQLQYLTRAEYNGSPRYLFARIDQKTLSFTFRLNYTLTPDLSIQYYGQPFISSIKFDRYKRITDSKANQFSDRFSLFNPNQITYNSATENYDVDENIDGNVDYSFEKPNFNVREFRSNLVFRWEYRRGSTLFLVWSQGISNPGDTGNFSFKNDLDDLFGTKAHNVFLIKFSYWFSR